jgi:hypothetical protein
MRRDFAAFRVFRGSLKKLETRKVTRKVANLGREDVRGNGRQPRDVSRFWRECSTEKSATLHLT